MKFPFARVAASVILWPLVANGTMVTTITDEDDGSLGGGTGVSLREAVNHSASGGIVTFAPALSGAIIRLALGEIAIVRSLTIDASSLPERINLSGDKTGDGQTSDDTRVLNITTGTVLLDSLVISGGYCPAGSATTQGGGIRVNSTTARLTLRDSFLTSNHAFNGAGIYFFGQQGNPNSYLIIENSTFAGNAASNRGGGISAENCFVQISNSLFSGNSVNGEGGAIWCHAGPLDIAATTLTGNSGAYGGAIHCTFGSELTVENCTLVANHAIDVGGGIMVGGALAQIRHSTLTGNTALFGGGGIWRKTSNNIPFGPFTLEKSILTNNTAPTTPDIDTGGSFTGSHNLTSGNPRLAPLGDYGGLTHTMLPLPGSPAIDAGGTFTLITDQRGFPRVSNPDIGAVEFQGNADIARVWTVDPDRDGSPFGVEHALGTDPSVADPADTRNLTVPTLDASGHARLSFGLAAAAAGTCWVLSHSTDLLTFSEIYRYDGITDTAEPGITFLRSATNVMVTDASPSPGGGFYRFEARFDP